MHTILIVDDEEDIRAVAALSLETIEGWTVHTAINGAEGVRRAMELQPEAILLDVMMPEMDGPTTFLALQQEPLTRNIPVLLLTAKVQGADQRRFAGLGVAAVLSKPFDPITLGSQIAAALGWQS
jgi:CheY-like chemotaxis protein